MAALVLRPSGSHRWGRGCAGAPTLEAAYPPEEEGPEAREGTAAHFYATEGLQGRNVPVGTLAPNGHPIDEEMVEAGGYLIADVLDAIALYGCAKTSVRVETPVQAYKYIHSAVAGTPDVFGIFPTARRVIVWDYKYGHRSVDAWRSPQGLCYMAGVLEAYELTKDDVANWRFETRIVQPRDYLGGDTLKRWEFDASEAFEQFRVLSAAAIKATGPNPPCVTGPYCLDCDGAHGCDALRRAGGVAMSVAGRAIPQTLDATSLGIELTYATRAVEMLKARITALTADGESRIKRGQVVPGWYREQGCGRKRWSKPVPEVIAMGDMLGVDLRKEAAAITPTQALNKLNVDAAVIDAYSETPVGKATLKPDSSTKAAKVFGVPKQG